MTTQVGEWDHSASGLRRIRWRVAATVAGYATITVLCIRWLVQAHLPKGLGQFTTALLTLLAGQHVRI